VQGDGQFKGQFNGYYRGRRPAALRLPLRVLGNGSEPLGYARKLGFGGSAGKYTSLVGPAVA